jgi:hypothetical protein
MDDKIIIDKSKLIKFIIALMEGGFPHSTFAVLMVEQLFGLSNLKEAKEYIDNLINQNV